MGFNEHILGKIFGDARRAGQHDPQPHCGAIARTIKVVERTRVHGFGIDRGGWSHKWKPVDIDGLADVVHRGIYTPPTGEWMTAAGQ